MTDEKLLKERFYPAMDEMYQKSDTVFPKEDLCGMEITFHNLCRFAPYMDDERVKRQFPLEFFYLPSKEYDEIVNKSVKGLHAHYVFPYRSEITYSDGDIEEMKQKIKEYTENDPEEHKWDIHDLNEKVKWNDEFKRRNKLWKEYYAKCCAWSDKLDKKEITRKEYNVEMKKLYKEYGCTKRCRDGEKLKWEFFDYGPNSSIDFFNAVKAAYNGEEADQKYKDRAEYVAKLAHDFVSNIKNNTPTWDGKQ